MSNLKRIFICTVSLEALGFSKYSSGPLGSREVELAGHPSYRHLVRAASLVLPRVHSATCKVARSEQRREELQITLSMDSHS